MRSLWYLLIPRGRHVAVNGSHIGNVSFTEARVIPLTKKLGRQERCREHERQVLWDYIRGVSIFQSIAWDLVSPKQL